MQPPRSVNRMRERSVEQLNRGVVLAGVDVREWLTSSSAASVEYRGAKACGRRTRHTSAHRLSLAVAQRVRRAKGPVPPQQDVTAPSARRGPPRHLGARALRACDRSERRLPDDRRSDALFLLERLVGSFFEVRSVCDGASDWSWRPGRIDGTASRRDGRRPGDGTEWAIG